MIKKKDPKNLIAGPPEWMGSLTQCERDTIRAALLMYRDSLAVGYLPARIVETANGNRTHDPMSPNDIDWLTSALAAEFIKEG